MGPANHQSDNCQSCQPERRGSGVVTDVGWRSLWRNPRLDYPGRKENGIMTGQQLIGIFQSEA